MRDTMKVIIFMIAAVIFYDLAESPAVKNFIPIAALLGIMAIGFVLLEKYDVLANRMAMKFNKIWVLAEILLFVYIGTEVKISEIDPSIIGGFILEFDGKVYNASLLHSLDQLKKKFNENLYIKNL